MKHASLALAWFVLLGGCVADPTSLGTAHGAVTCAEPAPGLQPPIGVRSIFDGCARPAVEAVADPNAVTLGVRFRPIADGRINAVRIYRGEGASFSSSTLAYPVAIWTAEGQRLASGFARISQNPSFGWLLGALDRAVDVRAGVEYVATYHAPVGNYPITVGALAEGTALAAVRALPDGGVYAYGPTETFPSASYRGSNYFVDVQFIPSRDCVGDLTGACGVPAVEVEEDRAAVTLGVRFRPRVDGRVAAVRFYRGPGTRFPLGVTPPAYEVALFRVADGARIDTYFARISQNPDNGWLTALSDTATAPLTAGEEYVVAYFAPDGAYAVTEDFFTAAGAFDPEVEVERGAGVFRYGPELALPTDTYRDSNYHIDVQFVATPTD